MGRGKEATGNFVRQQESPSSDRLHLEVGQRISRYAHERDRGMQHEGEEGRGEGQQQEIKKKDNFLLSAFIAPSCLASRGRKWCQIRMIGKAMEPDTTRGRRQGKRERG